MKEKIFYIFEKVLLKATQFTPAIRICISGVLAAIYPFATRNYQNHYIAAALPPCPPM